MARSDKILPPFPPLEDKEFWGEDAYSYKVKQEKLDREIKKQAKCDHYFIWDDIGLRSIKCKKCATGGFIRIDREGLRKGHLYARRDFTNIKGRKFKKGDKIL